MDDFLATLVSRTLGHNQSLLPRRAARFEPESSGQVADSPDEPPSDTAHRIETGQDPYAQHPRASLGDEEPEPGSRARHQGMQSARPIVAPTRFPERDGVVGVNDRAEVSGAAIPVVEHAPTEPAPSRPGHPVRIKEFAPDAPTPDESIHEESLDGFGHPLVIHEQSATSQSIIAPDDRRVSDDPPEDAGSVSPVDERSKTGIGHQVDGEEAVPHRPSPRFTTRIAAPDESESRVHDDEESLPGPRITVSIGRIDVRSAEPVPRTSPPLTPSRFEPRLTLGEYLERTRKVRR